MSPKQLLATAVSHYPKVGDGPGQQPLRQAIARFDRGEIDAAELAATADRVTETVLAEQADAGLDLVTDGQVRWQDPLTYIASRLANIEITGLLRWFESNTYYRQPVATGPVAWTAPILAADYEFAARRSRVPVKAVMTGPYTIAALSHSRHHRDLRAFAVDLARALNQELKALTALEPAPTWIQVDEPAIAHNPGVMYPREVDVFEEALAALTEGLDRTRTRLSLYVYHGDLADFGPDHIARLPFDLVGLDLVQGAASWKLVRDWPEGKALGAGVVDARNVRMEDAAEVRRQLEAIPDHVDEVHVSPSCGLEFLPRETARKKLELVAAAAGRSRVAS
jgi:5-methyltetrahydropteroyltriglutamate--homocysteine methyltransferase